MAATSPSAIKKTQKYDRQLRLWGDHGQSRLESAHVCLVGATALGTEILKNLVLPGIGGFTIVDGEVVTPADIGNNFFVTKDALGKPRAECAAVLLQELNSDVAGGHLHEDLETLLNKDPGYFSKFSVVIAAQLRQDLLLKLGARLWDDGIPLMVASCVGMMGILRSVIQEHPIVESRPTDTFPDLRVLDPFPELQQFCNVVDLENIDDGKHAHVPFPVLMLKALEKWTEENKDNPRLPVAYKDKKLFKETINSMRRPDPAVPGKYKDEQNFDDAIANVNKVLRPCRLAIEEIADIINDPKAKAGVTPSTPDFWVLVKALGVFVERRGVLPVRGSVPDMTADSESYVMMQRIYQAKAQADSDELAEIVQEYLSGVGRQPDSIPEADIRTFCKNCHFLRVVCSRSLEEEYALSSCKKDLLRTELSNPDTLIKHYLLWRAAGTFRSQRKFHAGEHGDGEGDLHTLKACVQELSTSLDLNLDALEQPVDLISEMCRWGGSELHSVAALLGGMAAQETIKIITRQYVPFQNTFIYDAVTCKSQTFDL